MMKKVYLPVLAKTMNGDVDRVKIMAPPTRAKPLFISASQLRDFLRCRLKWYWRHVLQLVPKQRAENLAIGTIVHAARERWYDLPRKERTVRQMRAITPRVLKELKEDTSVLAIENRELIIAMLTGYAEWAKVDDASIGLGNKGVSTEHWFELPLTDDRDIIVRGKIDLVFQPEDAKRTVAADECKTASQIRGNVIETNIQCSTYLWALRQLWPKFKSFLAYRTTMRKQMPGPRVTADLFHRECVERTPEEIDLWARDTRRSVMDMVGAAIYPHATNECAWDCDYMMPCLMRADSHDFNDVMQRSFMPKPPRKER